MDYKFHAPPAVAKTLDGYIIVGIHPPIPYTPEKLEEVKQAYENRVREHEKIVSSMTTKEVEVTSNSNPNKKYILTVYSDGKVECECKGFSFRRSCSHVDKYKKDNGL